MKANSTKAKLAAKETVFGCFVRYPNSAFVELLCYQGWDFVVFDGEHGTLEPADCEQMTRATELHGVTALVRVPVNQPQVLLRFLDTGAQGVHVPWVHTVTDAENAVSFAKYQPQGVRGLAGVRAADYGQRGSLAEYVQQANRETVVVVQIESKEGVTNVGKIVTVPGVDVVFLGPTDLSNSFGVPGDLKHPAVQQAIQQVTEAVLASDKALGIMVSNAESAAEWRRRGARYITCTTEAILSQACRDYLRRVRAG